LLHDVQRAAVEVQLIDAQSQDLALSQSATGAHVDHGPEALDHGVTYGENAVRLALRPHDPGHVEEGTTRYLAASGIEQIGYFDEIATRMPTPEEARLLEVGAGVPVLLWTRTGYSADRPIRCTITTFRGDLNYELRDRRHRRTKREPVIITPAEPQDVSKLLAFREEAAAWLRGLGSDQWSPSVPG
jgi:hypothetical protein